MSGTGIGALDHLGLVVADAERSAEVLATVSGVPAPQIRDNHAEGMRARDVRYRGELIGGGTRAACFTLAGASVNLMQPSGGPSPWSEYLEADGPGGCYLAFAVPDVPATLEALAALGYPTVQTGNTGGGASYGYGDARAELGVYLEILPDRAGPGGAGTLQPSEGAPRLAAVGFAVPDAAAAAAGWASVLGIPTPEVATTFSGDRLALLQLEGGTSLELRQPQTAVGTFSEVRDASQAAIHQCTLATTDPASTERIVDARADLGVDVRVQTERRGG